LGYKQYQLENEIKFCLNNYEKRIEGVMKNFNNKVAVITGAGGGIGGALAKALARRGCHLALVDYNPDMLEKTLSTLTETNVKLSKHIADVTDKKRMAALPDEIVAEHGRVDLLINNAGITLQKSFDTHSIEDWERILNLNFWGVLYGCKFFKPFLEKSKEAHVVNMSSMTGMLGLPAQSSYCATKAAVKGLTESLWAEWGAAGIGVTSVHPGAIKTDMMQATLKDSDDLAAAQKNMEMVAKIGMAPDAAAEKILRAVQKKKMKVLVGKDAVIMDAMKRFTPGLIHGLFAKVARKQLAAARN
jgi:short-subunit dehydrogenase